MCHTTTHRQSSAIAMNIERMFSTCSCTLLALVSALRREEMLAKLEVARFEAEFKSIEEKFKEDMDIDQPKE